MEVGESGLRWLLMVGEAGQKRGKVKESGWKWVEIRGGGGSEWRWEELCESGWRWVKWT